MFLVGEIGFYLDNADKMALFKAAPAPLDVYIDSDGGSVTAGNSFAALLRAHADNYGVEVRTIGIGLVASIATSVLLAGTTAEMDEDCMMMIHNPSVSWFSGDAEAMRQTADTLDKLKLQLVDMYHRKITKSGKATDKTRKEIERMMDAETWLTAKEALDLGLIDAIQTFTKEKEEAVNLMQMLPQPQQAQYNQIVNKSRNFKNNAQMQDSTKETEEKGLFARFLAWFKAEAKAEPIAEVATTPEAVVEPTVETPTVKTMADMTLEELQAEMDKRKAPQQETEMQAKLKAMETEIAMLKAKAPVTVVDAVTAPINESAASKKLREKKAVYYQNAVIKAAIENTKIN